MVFAAAPLRPTFTLLAGKFQADNPGSTVDFDFAGSTDLATRLTSGATADIFASTDTAQMDTVSKAGLTETDPVNFASNTLVIVTAPGDPKQIHSFADLAKPGLNVAVCREPVPCAAATELIEDNTGVHLNPVSEEPAVSDVLAKVTRGEADAGLVYVTSARAGAEVHRPGDRSDGSKGAQPGRLRRALKTRPAAIRMPLVRRRREASPAWPADLR
jgi:molybdate transport system substrate-binding protein